MLQLQWIKSVVGMLEVISAWEELDHHLAVDLRVSPSGICTSRLKSLCMDVTFAKKEGFGHWTSLLNPHCIGVLAHSSSSFQRDAKQ